MMVVIVINYSTIIFVFKKNKFVCQVIFKFSFRRKNYENKNYFIVIDLYFFSQSIYANDLNQNNKVKVEDAIIALQVSAGMKPELSIIQGIKWQGIWKESVNYKPYDIVQYDGSSYICISEHKSEYNNDSINNEILWNTLALKGLDGRDGKDGV
ncbi:MAG: hypothetical protein OMM_10990, partial [Candidatus Magnetoglobus multicellularis str. Araruama]